MKKVLLVEDNDDCANLVGWILESHEISCDWVTTGEEALQVTQQKNYDVIVMDIGLPGINGTETQQRLRSRADYKEIPIIAFTAQYQIESGSTLLDEGFTDLVFKPFDEKCLVRSILGNGQHED